MRRMMLAVALMTMTAGASAQDSVQDDLHTRALAAGYKAAFLCSGIFNAGQSEEQVAADDLEGIYRQYQAIVRTLPARVDREARMVSVDYAPGLPPRVAAWRPDLGCTQLPIGADAAMAAKLPRLSIARPAGDADRRAWPDGDAAATRPTPARLAAAVERGFDPAVYGAGARTTAILVVQDGKIVAERYRAGYDRHTPQRTWSVAKSISATVIGRAVQLGRVRIDDPAHIPEWRPGDPRGAITLAQLMHMNSGLWTDGPGNRTDEVYLGGGTVTQWAAAMPLEAAPGTRFRYANNDTLLAIRSVRAALGDGQEALDFPYVELFWRIGMNHTFAETDWQGNYILSSQVWTTARDLARLGLLYMNDGMWGGERLLPEGWSRLVATPAGAQPPQGMGYGALFWRYGPAQNLPEGTYSMNGNRGQYVVIIPSRKLVIVRRGFDREGEPGFDAPRFAGDLLAALD